MREIKFRAWNSETKTMGDPFLLQGVIERCNNTAARGVSTSGMVYQQYTGLKEENGTEIYEGDIVETWWDVGQRCKGFVELGDGWFSLNLNGSKDWPNHHTYLSAGEGKVIGNIYENPKLLNSS